MAQENTARVITIAATEQPQDIRLRVAAYARVSSSSDEQLISFAAQNRYYTEFISSKDNWQLVDIYADYGYSGTDSNRPSFQGMMKYVEDYAVSTLIVKDLSRLGREYSYMGRPQDFIFPAYDVRFIAVNDDVDSVRRENDFAVFKNVFNDYYAKDTSRKIRAVVKMRGEAGEHIASHPPFGYMKDPEDKKKWIVDEEAAHIVRRIFDLCIAGKVLAVTAYHARQEHRTLPDEPCRWNGNAVVKILECREYTGCTVNFKNYTKSLKFKKRMENPTENWRVFEDTQPAIIEPGQWERVQELRSNKRWLTKLGKTSIFSGLIYCADCGSKLYFCASRSYTESQNHFICSNYKSNTGSCNIHYIREVTLYKRVLECIQRTLTYVQLFRDDFIREVLLQDEASRKTELAQKLPCLLPRNAWTSWTRSFNGSMRIRFWGG